MGGKHKFVYNVADSDANVAKVDGVMEYIDWAVSQKFGVMDVNVPAYLTNDEVQRLSSLLNYDLHAKFEQDMDAFIPGLQEKDFQQQITSLVCYLYDNYLQLYDADDIFLMGVGNSYLGVKMLLISRGKHHLVATKLAM
jgi:histone deacetylase 6